MSLVRASAQCLVAAIVLLAACRAQAPSPRGEPAAVVPSGSGAGTGDATSLPDASVDAGASAAPSGPSPSAPRPWSREDSLDPSADARSPVPGVAIHEGDAVTVGAGLSADVVRREVRQRFGRFRLCYESGLRRNPQLAGDISLSFAIAPSGEVATVSVGRTNVADAAVVDCVSRSFKSMTFAKPTTGAAVKVEYSLTFRVDAKR